MLVWIFAPLSDPTSSRYRAAVAFHLPAETLRFFLFQNVENHPSLLEEFAMRGLFFGLAVLQWFCVFSALFVFFRLKPSRPTARKTAGS
jgi:hypothetical protein